MNKKLKLRNQKLTYYLKVAIIVTSIAFVLAIASSMFNKTSIYMPGELKTIDDTGYSEYSSGWPNHYYKYRTFMKDSKPVISEEAINWNSFAMNMALYYLPAYIIFIIFMKSFNIYRKK